MAKIDLHNTFFPGHEIILPELFAGRRGELERALKALLRPGSSIIVYGKRGVGKTSFVEMIKLIAQGNHELIFRHNLHKLYPPRDLRFKVISVESFSNTVTD